ncbi:MAG TPA: RHS repeat-associated core domain-containing protein [Anaerolineales bacterium]|nr:RHS repeat-associated core domain-containing protein [Anaerolineales bacterium]
MNKFQRVILVAGVSVLSALAQAQYFDAETELHYNGARYYDPKIGRYLSSDPIGLKGGLNTYAYVGNNPLRYIDPFGLAYFSKRPLHGLPWLGPASSNPIDDYFNTEISHEQLFFEDRKNPSNIGFFDDGTLKTEPNPTGYRNRSSKYDDDIMRKAVQNVELRPYCLLGKPGSTEKFNCQNWASEVRKEYRRLMNDLKIKKEKECQE